MQPLDKNTLFSIFEQGDEQVYKEHGVEEVLNNPFVLMGTVLQGLENYHLMDIMYTRQFGEKYQDVKSHVQLKYYTRLYKYLERIDSTQFDNKHQIGDTFDYNAVTGALATLLKFFEEIEHYEKCAVIKKYLDHLIENVYKKVV